MSTLKEIGKKAAAYAAIDKYVKSGQKVGIGSGSTITYAVMRLAERIKNESLSVMCVPTSFQSKLLLKEYEIPYKSLEEISELDIAFDGADEVDGQLNLIKGGGGCHLQEKLVAYCAKQLIIVADSTKDSVEFGTNWKKGIPIEVVPMAHEMVRRKIENTLGGKAVLRQAISKMGPVVTDNGNFIMDWIFDLPRPHASSWKSVDTDLHMIPGVIETGLFVAMATEAFFGNTDGSVYSRLPHQ